MLEKMGLRLTRFSYLHRVSEHDFWFLFGFFLVREELVSIWREMKDGRD